MTTPSLDSLVRTHATTTTDDPSLDPSSRASPPPTHTHTLTPHPRHSAQGSSSSFQYTSTSTTSIYSSNLPVPALPRNIPPIPIYLLRLAPTYPSPPTLYYPEVHLPSKITINGAVQFKRARLSFCTKRAISSLLNRRNGLSGCALAFTRYCNCQYCVIYIAITGGWGEMLYCALVRAMTGCGGGTSTKGGCAKNSIDSCTKAHEQDNILYRPSCARDRQRYRYGMFSPISPSPNQSLPTRVDEKMGSRLRMCTRSIFQRRSSGRPCSGRKNSIISIIIIITVIISFRTILYT